MTRETRMIKNKKSRVVTLYMKPENEVLYYQMREVLDREERSLSDFLFQKIAEYVAVHSTGNPQTMLEFAGLPKTLPLYRTCVHSNKEKSKGEIYCNKISDWRAVKACDVCGDYKEES